MIGLTTVISAILIYIALHFMVASYAYARYKKGKSIVSNSTVYFLSITVYCTSWTYYGSVGRAATTGLDFIAIYLGPSLTAFSWWFLLRKIVRITKENNITSIADFISSRYGKSQFLGALITLIAVLGIIPYIALQIKAVATTFSIICNHPSFNINSSLQDSLIIHNTGFLFSIFLCVFGIIFGARTIASTERHEGLVAAIAFEAVVKLLVFLAVGIYATYFLFDGFADIFARMERSGTVIYDHLITVGGTEETSYANWATNLFLAMSSIMLLPRQFQVMVIENSDEEHIKTAMWRFPAYLFAINFFVLPIAFSGILLSGSNSGADYFVLTIPMNANNPWLALFAFLGGFSAAAGMVIVESVAASTMILNHLLMPLVFLFKLKEPFSRLLLSLRRLSIIVVIFLGYGYYEMVGSSYMLVNIGLISFSAAAQLAPSLLGALYWRRGNLIGAATGIICGFTIWFYTLLLPSFIRSGWWDTELLEKGPFGWSVFKPTELFGLTGLDIWSNTLFWSMLFNVGAYLFFSITVEQSETEKEQSIKFIDPFRSELRQDAWETKRLSKPVTIMEFVNLMENFIGEKHAHAAISNYLMEHEIDEKGMVSEFELPSLKRFVEKTIAGSVGSAAAKAIVESHLSEVGSQMESFYDAFRSVRSSLEESREALYVRLKSSEIMNRSQDLHLIINELAELLRAEFRFDLIVIRLINSEGKLVAWSSLNSTPDIITSPDIFPTDDHFIGELISSRRSQFVNDTTNLRHYQKIAGTDLDNFSAFAHIPIAGEGDPTGVLSIYSSSIIGLFTEELLNLLTSLAGQLALAVQLVNERGAKEREREEKELALLKNATVVHEMELAKQIQLSLLPETPPKIPGMQIASLTVSADHVGGDYYDFFTHDDRIIDAVIADVSGHNVGAALIMVETRSVLRVQVNVSNSPGKILSSLNDLLLVDLSRAELFITMFYVKYDTVTQWLSYASAGHNHPLLFNASDGTCHELDADGLILGVKEGVHFEEKSILLDLGDLLLLYTDGLTETFDSEGEMFGIERLSAILQEFHNAPLQNLIDTIYRELINFAGAVRLADDVTIIAMRVDRSTLDQQD